MFVSMAAGELLIDSNLFSGFLKKPFIWYGIFLETGAATLLFSTIGLLILSRFRFLGKKAFSRVSLATWIFLSIILMALYAYFYWPREWHLTALTPGLIFGWLIPGILTIGWLVLFSLDLRQSTSASKETVFKPRPQVTGLRDVDQRVGRMPNKSETEPQAH